ncbi:MAG TPA: lysophospholipid acyltransferase family protein [Pyrinomonadaceae bacterium]
MGESISYRSIVVASQYASWLFGQLLRLRYSILRHFPTGLFERNRGHCLILAANHRTYVDLGLLMVALGYRRLRFLVPVRTLGTQDFRSPVLQWLKPLIKIIYRLEGVIALPSEEHDDRSLPEKLRGMLVALHEGEVAAIFPEGQVWRKHEPPIGEFAPGVAYLHKKSRAPIVPIAIWMSERWWPRRRCVVEFGEPVRIPEDLDQDTGTAWLRERVLKLYEQAKLKEGQ